MVMGDLTSAELMEVCMEFLWGAGSAADRRAWLLAICVSAWVTSADGATTYQEVGYRSPAGAEGDVLEVLS